MPVQCSANLGCPYAKKIVEAGVRQMTAERVPPKFLNTVSRQKSVVVVVLHSSSLLSFQLLR
jgi:hypothetical protein